MAVTSIDLHLEGDVTQVYLSGERVKGSLVVHIGLPVIIAGNVCFICIVLWVEVGCGRAQTYAFI